MSPAAFLSRQRVTLGALAASAALHAAVIVGWPALPRPFDQGPASYDVVLIPDPDAVAVVAAPAPRPAPRRPRARPSAPKPQEAIAELPPLLGEAEVAAPEETSDPSTPHLLAGEDVAPAPERVALAEPATPIPALAPPRFPGEALPAKLSITYALNSPFADGRAEYTWRREGDRYEISGAIEAVGFFAVFLEGRILQESRGTVTAEGLKPERFTERRPGNPQEGLDFDWERRTLTFVRRDQTREGVLTDNTVDWLSMIFQLAHAPPAGERLDLRVYTQRRLYSFSLESLGIEEIEIPIGKVRALHLRHSARGDAEAVDVWLGIDHQNLPVKLRYPVARNRFMVEQVATDISSSR
jgi:hypothetical protein